uniref:Amino acid transporter transmembrane domain-containing protein n=1 Tax=Salix viminalis TaxID=40686 RepID=A0A6N2MCT7_SALVM
MTVYFPVEMHIAQNKIKRLSLRGLALQLLNLVCFLVSIAAASSAIQAAARWILATGHEPGLDPGLPPINTP